MRQEGQKPETAAERDARASALLEQLLGRQCLEHYREIGQAVLPALKEAGAERARQIDGELATAAEREAIAERAGQAVRKALLGVLQVPQAQPAKATAGKTE